LLKLYKTTDEFVWEIPLLPKITSDQEKEFEVESILDKKFRYNKFWYLIKWKGYPLHDTT
jgi:hypothetical protein